MSKSQTAGKQTQKPQANFPGVLADRENSEIYFSEAGSDVFFGDF